MTFEDSQKATLHFLNTIDDKGLYKYNGEYFDEEFHANFQKFAVSFEKVFSDIVKYALTKSNSEQKDWLSFMLFVYASSIISYLEYFNKFLKTLINSELVKDGFTEDTTLGSMVYKICKKLGYTDKLWTATFDLFCVDFRNAIAHQHYQISDGVLTIYPKNDKKKHIFDTEKLMDYSDELNGILSGLLEFNKKKLEEMNKEIVEFEKKI